MRGWACVVLLISAAGCGPETPVPAEPAGQEPVVATVGGEPVYARDFVLNYEFGFPQLHRGSNARLAYLNRIVDEKLLALDGTRRGLLDNPEVRRNIEDLRDELLVEQLFQRHVNDRVDVTPEDIVSAMQQAQTSFRLRYLPARSLPEALEFVRRR